MTATNRYMDTGPCNRYMCCKLRFICKERWWARSSPTGYPGVSVAEDAQVFARDRGSCSVLSLHTIPWTQRTKPSTKRVTVFCHSQVSLLFILFSCLKRLKTTTAAVADFLSFKTEEIILNGHIFISCYKKITVAFVPVNGNIRMKAM